MSDKVPPRKRFYIDGLPSTMSTAHTQYIKPVNELLRKTQERMNRLTEGAQLRQLTGRRTTEDGATLTAISGPHGDEIRIDVPRQPMGGEFVPPPVPKGVHTDPKLAPHEPGYLVTNPEWTEHFLMSDSAAPILNYEHHTAEGPPYSEDHPKKEVEEPTEQHPYLWIGARIAWERMPAGTAHYDDGSLLLAVFEPPKLSDPPDVGGVVSSVPVQWFDAENDDNVFDAVWSEINLRDEITKARWWVSRKPATRYVDPGVTIYPIVQVTPNGMYMVQFTNFDNQPLSAGLRRDGIDPGQDYGGCDAPYDPIVEGSPEGETAWEDRMFGAGGQYENSTDSWPLWSQVVVLDPAPWVAPFDRRDTLTLYDKDNEPPGMFTSLGISPVARSGKYVIKVGCGTECQNPTTPMEVDLEVRVGKFPLMARKRFELTINNASSWTRNKAPYGLNIPDIQALLPCEYPSGTNTHWNWHPGAVVAVPHGPVISDHLDEVYLPPYGFTPAPWSGIYESCGTQAPVLIFVAAAYPTSIAWEATLTHAFAFSVVNWDVPNPWRSPGSVVDPGSEDPTEMWAVDFEQRARDAGVEAGKTYRWGNQPVGTEPAGDFTDTGIVPDQTGDTAWINACRAIAIDEGAAYAVVILIGAVWTQVVAVEGDGCPQYPPA